MAGERIVFRFHAVQRMFERKISEADVRSLLKSGEVIASYPDDEPYPSQLILGFVQNRPLHVVVANNRSNNESIVITVYEPDPKKWQSDFRRKK